MAKTALALSLFFLLLGYAYGRTPSERSVAISTKPELQNYQGVLPPGILLHQGGITYQSGWVDGGQDLVHLYWPIGAPQPASLDPASTYTFDLLVEKNWLQMGFSQLDTTYTATLVRLSLRDHTLYDGTQCPLHHVTMKRQFAPIHYGFSGETLPFANARKAAFPNARLPVDGGCSVNSARTKTFVWVCPDCEAAYKKYEAAH